MKNKLLFFTLFTTGLLQSVGAQNGIWTWMSGSATVGSPGNFGVQGVPSPTNQPPAVYEVCEWTDLNGNFWIFGGDDGSGTNVNAGLWKYDVATGLWTWMKGSSTPNASGVYGTQGIPSPTNNPGSRTWGAYSWTDLNGDLWLFGGWGYDGVGGANALNDLWRYNIATNEWTWMKGSNMSNDPGSTGILQIPSPTNDPDSRYESNACWVDNAGNFWLYGGISTMWSGPAATSDAMWKYNPGTNEWTWMSGQASPLVLAIPPNYGTIGVPATTNTPGSRMVYNHWKDKQGNFWFYGGMYGLEMNDMWMYNPVTNLWTWMAGTQTPNFLSTFTQQCIPGSGLPSGAAENRVCWTDECGRFWQFSGGALVGSIYENTLWLFDPNTLQFTWIKGSLNQNPPGNFGTFQVPAATNSPPGLAGGNAFKSLNGDLWMFGGASFFGPNNALWRYQIDPNCPVTPFADFTTQPDSVACGTPFNTQFIPLSTTATSYHWDFGDASTLVDTSNQDTTAWTFNQAGTYPVTLIIDGGCGLDTFSIMIRVANPPVLDIGIDTTLCAGQTIALNTTIPGSYVWNTGDTTASIQVNTAGQYSIQITTDTFNCIVSDTIAIAVNPMPIPNLGADTAVCNGQIVLLNPGTFDSYQWNTGATTATLTANTQGNYSVLVQLNKCFNSDTIFIRVDEEPTIGVGTDSVRCHIVLDAGNPGASYLWNTGETTQTITATQTGTYSVTITNGVCVVVDSITIAGELGGGLLYIPNAFTPDQNGLNEKFQPVGTNIVDFSMAIYNRWGELVYETNDINKGWDGRRNGNLVQQDVYVYAISYSSDCLDGKQVRKMGQVTVIR